MLVHVLNKNCFNKGFFVLPEKHLICNIFLSDLNLGKIIYDYDIFTFERCMMK